MKIALFFKQKTVQIWLWYGILAVILLFPLLLPGYILTLDLVFTPHFELPTELDNTYPLQVLLWLLHFLLPGDVIEKLVLFAILLLSGTGMHLLVRSAKPKTIEAEYWNIAAWFSGIFYVINPFTYARFMAGQWMVLLGYALIPFFICILLRCISAEPSRRRYFLLTGLALLILCVSIHFVGILLLLLLFATSELIRKKEIRNHLRYIGESVGLFFVVSLYWLMPLALGKSSIGQAVASFGDVQFHAFQTAGGSLLGMVSQVIRLQGFWAETRQLFILPQQIVPLWGVVVAVLWALVIFGVRKAWRTQRTIVVFSLLCILGGVIFSTTPLVGVLSHIVPFFAGYREPHKFTVLIVVGYAILGAYGVAYLLQTLQNRRWPVALNVAGILGLVLPILITPTMLWGFAGQLKPTQYPREWYEMNSYMKREVKGNKVLFLPWHQYANHSFSNRIIANPAEKFFEVNIVTSDDPEFNGAPPTVPNKEKAEITRAIKEKQPVVNILSRHAVQYLLVANEQNYHDYDYLRHNVSLEAVQANKKLTLYKMREI